MITDQYVRKMFKEGENWSRVTGATVNRSHLRSDNERGLSMS